MITLIGICGPARHGKDTVGSMLLEHIPKAKRFAYADKIKELLKASVSSHESMEDNKEGEQEFILHPQGTVRALKDIMDAGDNLGYYYSTLIKVLYDNHEVSIDHEFTSSWRKLFQLVGTEWARQYISRSIWIDHLPDELAVVTDVRAHGDSTEFKNIEAKAILDRGGIMIKVINPRKDHLAIREHSSEVGIDDLYIDYVIINDGTLEDLQEKVNAFVYTHLLIGEE
jgi:hypothetical protein